MARCILPLILLAVLAVHLAMAEPGEPFYNGDETRHVMTGIFVADAIRDGGYRAPKLYAERYYAQYPALGLIVWPPGFYAVEGTVMFALGRSFAVARGVELAYLMLACVMLFRLAKLTHGFTVAMVATLVFALSREVFFHSRSVMLEVPTLAFVLMAMLHLELFLKSERRRDLVFSALACVLAGLHRYDAVFLMILVALRLLFARRFDLLLRRSVIIAGVIVIGILAPVYGFAAYEIGNVQASAATAGSDPTVVQPSRVEQFTFLFATLWAQIGHAACVLGAIGLLLSLRKVNRAKSAPYWALALSAFAFFAPLAEQETRHGVYWIPAWAVFAADAALLPRRKSIAILLSILLVSGTAFWTLKQPVPWVRGYAAAAEFAVREIPGSGIVLFDGHMSGTMVYELRTHDAERRLCLLRADKLLYASLSDPSHGYIEWAADDATILSRLEEIGPDLILIEEPRARVDNPMAKKLRTLLKSSNKYIAVAVFPIANNNLEWIDDVKVIAYKPKKARPPGERRIAIPMLWQGTRIDAVIPPR